MKVRNKLLRFKRTSEISCQNEVTHRLPELTPFAAARHFGLTKQLCTNETHEICHPQNLLKCQKSTNHLDSRQQQDTTKIGKTAKF